MLNEVNDEEQHAHLLGKLLETFDVVCHSSDCISCYPNKLVLIQQAIDSSHSPFLSFQAGCELDTL